MHISDNILPPPVWIGGYTVTAASLGLTLRRLTDEELTRTAVFAGLFFVASSISAPLPWGSVHLILVGLLGVVLGWRSVPAFFVALVLQLLIFHYGGWTTLGINTLNMSLGAMAARGLFRARRWLGLERRPVVAGGLAGGGGALAAAGSYFACLLSAGDGFRAAAQIALVAHAPVIAVEAAVSAFAVRFLSRVEPALLKGHP